MGIPEIKEIMQVKLHNGGGCINCGKGNVNSPIWVKNVYPFDCYCSRTIGLPSICPRQECMASWTAFMCDECVRPQKRISTRMLRPDLEGMI